MQNTVKFSRFLRPSVIAPLLGLLYGLAVIIYYAEPLALVTLGSDYAPAELQAHTYSAEGYDGQSVYYLARYGWEAAPYLDVPAYRAQRILLPILARTLSFGQAEALPFLLSGINLIALAAGTWLLERLLQGHRAGAWLAAGYAFSLGVLGAARLNTTETLTYGLVIGAIYLIVRRKQWFAGMAVLGAAALGKEMALIFPAALCAAALGHAYQTRDRRELGQAVLGGTIALLPFLMWQIILYNRFGAFGMGSGGEKATSFELIPFMGMVRIWTEGSAQVFALLMPILVPFVLLPTAWALWQCWQDGRYSERVKRGAAIASQMRGWDVYTTLLLANAGLMLFVPFSTYREYIGILRFIVGLQIAVILYAAARRRRRALVYSTIWFTTIFLLIAADFAR